MDVSKLFQNLFWCKSDWSLPSFSKETKNLLEQCSYLTKVDLSNNVEEVIKRSKSFPIPFPIDTVRLLKLKEQRPIEKLKKNIESTYPLIHERVFILMTYFLIYKREFGSSIEREFYKKMTVPQLIDRILQKRAIVFMKAQDVYKLMDGQKGTDGWESVGTLQQQPPLTLERVLSYDEMKLAAMVYVSGHTECINDGDRKNKGVPSDNAENDAVIIGVIGPRFKRKFRMDYEDMLITPEQNRPENGFGKEETPNTFLEDLKSTQERNEQIARRLWRKMWAEFYQVPSYTYEELTSEVNIQKKPPKSMYIDRYVMLKGDLVFDNEVYYKRLCIIAETVLLEAEDRAKKEGKYAFVNVIGAGLGVWKVSAHQNDVFILTFLERTRAFLKKDLLNHVTDVNFGYIKPSPGVLALFKNATSSSSRADSKSANGKSMLFLESKNHPKGGVNVQLEDRNPSAKLTGEHKGKLLIMTYPWDSNAHPGNEFWLGKLHSSGDPAAACSTQISELHNAHINPNVNATQTRVAGTRGVTKIARYCDG